MVNKILGIATQSSSQKSLSLDTNALRFLSRGELVRIKRKGEKFQRNTVFSHIFVSIAILTKSPWGTYKKMIKDHISLKFCALYVPQPLEISCFIYETLEIVMRVKVSTIACTSPKNNIA